MHVHGILLADKFEEHEYERRATLHPKSKEWNKRNPVSRCEHIKLNGEECGVATRGGKSRCFDHIEDLAYVKQVIAKLDESEREEVRIAEAMLTGKKPKISFTSEVVRDILIFLRTHGSATIDRLASKVINKTPEMTEVYARFIAESFQGVTYLPHPRAVGVLKLAGWEGCVFDMCPEDDEVTERTQRALRQRYAQERKDKKAQETEAA